MELLPRGALRFEIREPGAEPRAQVLNQPIIKIGKLKSSHVHVRDDTVSRMHAVIEVEGGEITLIDLGSTRGTYVNGKKINKCALRVGDRIEMGESELRLVQIGDAAAMVSSSSLGSSSSRVSSLSPPVREARVARDAKAGRADTAARIADMRKDACPVCGHAEIRVTQSLYAPRSPRPDIDGVQVGPFHAYVCGDCGYTQWFSAIPADKGLLAPR